MKHPFVYRLLFTLAGAIIIVLLVALISLQYNNAFAEGVTSPTSEAEEDDCIPAEYWDKLSALFEAFYEVPEEWAEQFAPYLDMVAPYDVDEPAFQLLDTIDLGLDDPTVALYWVVGWDWSGDISRNPISDSETGPRLVWPVADPYQVGEEFAQIVSGMKPGEIWEFVAHEDRGGYPIKYLVLATPDVASIRELRLALDSE